jgi:outer membrane protein TolC
VAGYFLGGEGSKKDKNKSKDNSPSKSRSGVEVPSSKDQENLTQQQQKLQSAALQFGSSWAGYFQSVASSTSASGSSSSSSGSQSTLTSSPKNDTKF